MILKTHIVYKRFYWFLPYSNTVHYFYEFISNHDDYSSNENKKFLIAKLK